MKSFKDRGSGLIEARKIIGFGRLASVASTFYKIIKIISRYIKVFGFALAALASLYRSSEIFNIKAALLLFIRCYVATKSHEGYHAST